MNISYSCKYRESYGYILRVVSRIRHGPPRRLLNAPLARAIAELPLATWLSRAIGRITQIGRIGILDRRLVRTRDARQIRKSTGYAEEVAEEHCGKGHDHN